MAKIAKEEIEALRSKADIVQIVGRYIPLSKSGKIYRGLCPFHDDHDPSFQVNPDKQFAYCFVCHTGGDVFRFVELYEHVNFTESVAKVAEMVGFSLSKTIESKSLPIDPRKKELWDITQKAIEFTSKMLTSERSRIALQYLAKRGLNRQTIETFEIGFDPDRNSLHQYLTQAKIPLEKQKEAYLVNEGEYGIYDIFHTRITFPIHDPYGHPIGFTARSIDPEAKAKYINTAQTYVYKKGDIVFNAHRAKRPARKEGVLYVVEGVMDVIALHNAGIENVVCTLGTACTQEQMQILKRLAPLIVFCYDGDRAGRDATWKVLQLALSKNAQVAVVDNPTGKDPDELLRANGKEYMKEFVSHRLSWFEFYLDYEAKRSNLEAYLGKKDYLKKAQAQYVYVNDPYDKEYYQKLVLQYCGLPLNITSPVQKSLPIVQSANTHYNGVKSAMRQILTGMLQNPEYIALYRDTLGYLPGKTENDCANMFLANYAKGMVLSPHDLIHQTDDKNIQNLLIETSLSTKMQTPVTTEMFKGAMKRIQRHYFTEEINAYKKVLADPKNQGDAALLQKYQEALLQLRRLHDE